MEFYLSLDGAKAGPFTLFKVGELLESGAATPDTLAWHRDQEGWRPIREVPALEAFLQSGREGRAEPGESDGRKIAAPKPAPRGSGEPEPDEGLRGTPLPEIGHAPAAVLVAETALDPARPFVRFWARMFDYTLVSVVVFQLSAPVFTPPQPGESVTQTLERYLSEMGRPEAIILARTLFFAMLGWQALEAVLVHLFGTTPGKALLGIRIVDAEGDRVPLARSLGRAFAVYVLGAGFYQFPFILIGMVFSFFRLTATGISLWDQHLRTRVEHAPLGPVRIMLAIGAFFVLLTFQTVRFS
jgi:uncharacterized RDD family membrane protein YckC